MPGPEEWPFCSRCNERVCTIDCDACILLQPTNEILREERIAAHVTGKHLIDGDHVSVLVHADRSQDVRSMAGYDTSVTCEIDLRGARVHGEASHPWRGLSCSYTCDVRLPPDLVSRCEDAEFVHVRKRPVRKKNGHVTSDTSMGVKLASDKMFVDASRWIRSDPFVGKCIGDSALTIVVKVWRYPHATSRRTVGASAIRELIRRDEAARCIQRAWRLSISSPDMRLCRRRLLREFTELGQPPHAR